MAGLLENNYSTLFTFLLHLTSTTSITENETITAIAWFSPYAQNVFKGKMELTKINEFNARARLNYVMTLNLAGEIKILCSSIALTQIISFYVLQQMEHVCYAILVATHGLRE